MLILPFGLPSMIMRATAISAMLGLVGTAGAAALITFWPLPAPVDTGFVAGDAKRGAYLARLSGCVACHTSADGEPLAGGVALPSRFGTFYSPNITPHPKQGIGEWSYNQFARAVRQGVSPEGHAYYPAFPFEFYAALTDQDLADIWTAIRTVPVSSSASRDHEVGFPFNIRSGLKPWRTFFARDHTYDPRPDRSALWNQGKYLVEGPAHCAACHTPRNIAGGLEAGAALAGDPLMMDGDSSPAITADELRRRGWTVDSLVSALKIGITPEGDAFGGSMAEVVHDGTSYLLTEHLRAIATYLLDQKQ